MKRRGPNGAIWFVVAQLLAMPALAESYYYEATTLEQDDAKDGQETVRMRGWVDGTSMKIEFVDGKKDLPDGSYLLTTDGGETIHFVNPQKRGYALWDLDEVIERVAGLLDGKGMVKLELSDVVDEELLEEPGEEMLGFPTTHRRRKSGYTAKYAVLGIGKTQRKETVRDVWVYDEIAQSGIDALLKPSRIDTGYPELDRALTAELGRAKGFPLKSVVVTTLGDGKGKDSVRRATTEVTSFERREIGGAVFEIPEGFEEKGIKKLR
jgi:hypothetical protein